MLSRRDTAEQTAPTGADRQATEGARLQTIVVATDGSPSSRDAIAFAVELAAEHGADVHFVHVVPTLDLVPPFALGDVGLAFAHEPTRHDYDLLADAATYASERGVAATTSLLGGSTSAEVVAYAEEHNADMIIVGSRGHGAASSALLGSVSLGVLAASRRPVLIIHGTSPFRSWRANFSRWSMRRSGPRTRDPVGLHARAETGVA